MKQFLIISGIAAVVAGLASCGGANGSDPGRAYMPDMYYSRAYEAYGYNTTDKDHAKLMERGIHYNGLPVAGTIARGDASSYLLPANDTGYVQSSSIQNPFRAAGLTDKQRSEAERLYLINCAICHGTALDGNGPLWKGGDGPYPAAPRNLKDDYSKQLSDGQMYHVIMYGKGQMGSYASQVQPAERWWIIQYIREQQGGAKTAAATDSAAVSGTNTANVASAGADTTKRQ